MKILKVLLLFCFLCTCTYAQQGKLVVKVMGVKTLSGAMAVALYSSPDTFLKESFINTIQDINSKNVAVTINNIPPGTYGVSMFQDENSNKKLDRNFFGIPKEPFAFGNNAMGMFGPPEFYAASVEIKSNRTTTMVIVLNDL